MEDQNEVENSESTESVRNPNEIRFYGFNQGSSDRPKLRSEVFAWTWGENTRNWAYFVRKLQEPTLKLNFSLEEVLNRAIHREENAVNFSYLKK